MNKKGVKNSILGIKRFYVFLLVFGALLFLGGGLTQEAQAAVAYDARSESDTGTTGATATYSWTHTPSGTPKGVVVFVFNNDNAYPYGDVTYGGVVMTAVTGGSAADTAGEPGTCRAYFLGSGIPTGQQTVQVVESGTMTASYAVAYTVTALTNTEVTGVSIEEENQTLTEVNVDDGSPGTNSVRFAGTIWGDRDVPTVGANSTGGTAVSIDFGLRTDSTVVETTAGQSSRPVGWDTGATTDDVAAVYLAVRELSTTYTQNYYQFYVDNDAAQPTDPWPAGASNLAQNTPITTSNSPPDDDALVRIRMSVTVGGVNLAAEAQAFKLQYATNTGGPWTNVGAASSAAIWRGESDGEPGTPPDGTTLTAILLDPSDRLESYEEENDSVANPIAIAVTEDGEWDWLVQNNGAAHDCTYYFRMVKANETAFGTYTRYPTITTESTVFDSSFENGNGATFVKPYSGDSTKVSFNSELDGVGPLGPCDNSQKQNWFYFSMNNALNQTLEFTLLNATASNNENTDWVDHKPVYSYDQVTWYRIASVGSLSGTVDWKWTFPTFTSDTVYIAHNIPYTYADSETDLAVWDDSPYVTVTDIGNSVQSRTMHLVTIQDTNSPVAAADKKVYWFIARQHPMESMASYAIKGIINFLIGSTDEAKLMRRSSIFKIIPMMNPDGVYLGHTTANAEYCNLNREWTDVTPDPDIETDEVYNAHVAIDNWMNSGTPADADVITDMHTRCADPGIYHSNAAWYDTANNENPFEILWDKLDGNAHNDEFTIGVATGNSVEMFDQYHTAGWGNDLEALNVEGTTYNFSDGVYPTPENAAAFGISYLKTIWAVKEASAKVFLLRQTDPNGTTTPPQYTVVGSPGQYFIVLNNDKGGGIDNWYDRENNPLLTQQLNDDTSWIVDKVAWEEQLAGPTYDYRHLAAATNATLTVESNSGTRVRFKYEGLLDDLAGYNYTHTQTIWEDGRIWSDFNFTNNKGSAIDWRSVEHVVSTEYNYASSLVLTYDDTDATPTVGSQGWWGLVGNGTAGIKAVVIGFYVPNSGGWTYDTYSSASSAASGQRNWYADAEGLATANGASLETFICYQIRPDSDVINNDATIDPYKNDIANPDLNVTMTTGTFTEFDKQEGGLKFATTTNNVKFTYTNADTITKKKPVYIVTGWTASRAPVLKVDNAYLDGEDGEIHPADTHIGASYTSYVDTTNDIAYVQYLLDISTNIAVEIKDYFIITDIRLVDFYAIGYEDSVEITWQTGCEIDNVGFNLYRSEYETGSYTKINPFIIAGAGDTFIGNSYTYVDTGVINGQIYYYKLEDIERNGTTQMHGPAVAHPGLDSDGDGMSDDWENYYGLNPHLDDTKLDPDDDGRDNYNEYNARTNPTQKDNIFGPITSAAGSSNQEEIIRQGLPPGERTYNYRISVDEDGIYKVTKDDFIALGINPDEIDPHEIELYNKGEEIAINIKLDYENDTLDYIEFFGQANDSKYSLENIYWLKIRSETALEMGERDVDPDYGGMNIDYYIDNIHFEENLLYQRSILEGEDVDHWFWRFLIAPNTIDVDFEILDIAQVPEFAELEVKLQGYSYPPQNPDHHVRIYLNDNLLGDAWWNNATQYIFEADIPLDYLINGQNILSLEAPGDTGAPIDTVYLDYFVITYPGQFIAQEDILRFELQEEYEKYLIEASGFSNSAIELFDITQPEHPVKLLNADILPGGGNYTVIFSTPESTNEKEYLILTNDKKLSPYSIIEDALSNLHSVQNQADYIIITHADFEEGVLPLAQWRQDNGLEVKVVDIQDIYNEFNFGIFNPEAIKTFLGYAYNYWLIPPQYILLVGDASYDYKDYLGLGSINYIPTIDIETNMMLAPSDNWFVCVEGEDNLPDIAIGRLPVSTTEELGFIINKIIDYESGLGAAGWNENIMLVADDDEAIFETMQDELESNYIWPSFDVSNIYLSQYLSSTLCHQDIIDGINGGALILNYAGHGAEPIWADELILTASDIGLLNNYQMYPVVPAMTCLNNYFHYPYPWFYIISETFLKAENKGVIGFWSLSGLTSTSEHRILENGFYSAVFQDNIRILGDAIKEAENYLYDNLPPAEDSLKTIILLGDPALELALPQ